MPTGVVTKFFDDKGFGFIAPDDGGEEVFVHRKIAGSQDRTLYLDVGDEVEFEVEFNEANGKVAATRCTGFKKGTAQWKSGGPAGGAIPAYGGEYTGYGGEYGGPSRSAGAYGAVPNNIYMQSGGQGGNSFSSTNWAEKNCMGIHHPIYGGGHSQGRAGPYGAAAPAARRTMGGGTWSKGGSYHFKAFITNEQLGEQLYNVIHEQVSAAVKPIAHQEETWSPEEMTKRIVRYLSSSLSKGKELPRTDWQKAVRHFVEQAMWNYMRACGDKKWYNELDLMQTLVAAAMTIAEACHGGNPDYGELEQFVIDIHDLLMQKSDVDKKVWEVIEANVVVDEKAQGKLFKAWSKSYDSAFERTRTVKGKRANMFLKEWLSDGLQRARHTIETNTDVLAKETLIKVFAALLTPDDGNSCMPATFGDAAAIGNGRDAVQAIVEEVVGEWAAEAAQRAVDDE